MPFGGRLKGAGDAAPLWCERLPLVPLPFVLLHIGPGVVVDVALLVPVFTLLQVSILRSAMLGPSRFTVLRAMRRPPHSLSRDECSDPLPCEECEDGRTMLTLALIVFGMRIRFFGALVRMSSRPLPIAWSHDCCCASHDCRAAPRCLLETPRRQSCYQYPERIPAGCLRADKGKRRGRICSSQPACAMPPLESNSVTYQLNPTELPRQNPGATSSQIGREVTF